MATKKETTRVTVKGVISEGILAGHTVARILKDVAKKKPESVADETHIKYYSGVLKREGSIDDVTHAKYAGKPGRKAAGKAEAKPKAKADKKSTKKVVAKKATTKKVAKESPAKKARAARKTKK